MNGKGEGKLRNGWEGTEWDRARDWFVSAYSLFWLLFSPEDDETYDYFCNSSSSSTNSGDTGCDGGGDSGNGGGAGGK